MKTISPKRSHRPRPSWIERRTSRRYDGIERLPEDAEPIRDRQHGRRYQGQQTSLAESLRDVDLRADHRNQEMSLGAQEHVASLLPDILVTNRRSERAGIDPVRNSTRYRNDEADVAKPCEMAFIGRQEVRSIEIRFGLEIFLLEARHERQCADEVKKRILVPAGNRCGLTGSSNSLAHCRIVQDGVHRLCNVMDQGVVGVRAHAIAANSTNGCPRSSRSLFPRLRHRPLLHLLQHGPIDQLAHDRIDPQNARVWICSHIPASFTPACSATDTRPPCSTTVEHTAIATAIHTMVHFARRRLRVSLATFSAASSRPLKNSAPSSAVSVQRSQPSSADALTAISLSLG